MWADFLEKLGELRASRESNLALFMNPRLENLPLPISRFDDPLLPYGKEIIKATQEYVAAYVFDLASYLALGAAGAVALERTIRFASRDNITFLHAPFASDEFSAMADATAFGVDAITVSDSSLLRTYLDKPPYAAFAMKTGLFDINQIPAEGGLLWEDGRCFAYLDKKQISQTLKITDKSFLFTSKGEDYLSVLRQKLERIR